jgi:hypothetical protein
MERLQRKLARASSATLLRQLRISPTPP